LAAVMLVVPVRDSPVREVDSFIPAVDGIMLFGELITATLLYSQASVFRSRALVVLASSYVFGALLLIAHALTFPGAFAPDGLLGAGVNTTAWIYTIRRVAFPIAIIFYVYLRDADASLHRQNDRPPAKVRAGLLLACALAAAVTMLTTVGQGILPSYFLNRSDLIYTYAVADQSAVFGLYVVATAVLIPGQSGDACAIEIVGVGVVTGLVVLRLQSGVRGIVVAHGDRGPTWGSVVSRRLLGFGSAALLVVAGVTLLAQGGGGLYWWPAAIVVAYLGALIDAWVLLVEILR